MLPKRSIQGKSKLSQLKILKQNKIVILKQTNKKDCRVPIVAQLFLNKQTKKIAEFPLVRLRTQPSVHEDAGLICGLAQGVKVLALSQGAA